MPLDPAQRLKVLDIARRQGAGNVRLFGSRARGTHHSGSDLDLLVQFEPQATLLTVIGFQQALGFRVDVVEEGGLSPLMAATVLREAVAL